MSGNRGFTLMELLVVLIIVGVLTAIALPNYFTYLEQNRAQTAQNNLMAISAAQSKFSELYNQFCINSGTNPTPGAAATLCGDSMSDLSTFLNLSQSTSTTDTFQYCCEGNGNNSCTGSISACNGQYCCVATDTPSGPDTLTLNYSTVNGPVITCTGGKYCPTNLQ